MKIKKTTIVVNFPADFSESEAKEIIQGWKPDEMASCIINGHPVIWAHKRPQFDRNVATLLAKGVEFRGAKYEEKDKMRCDERNVVSSSNDVSTEEITRLIGMISQLKDQYESDISKMKAEHVLEITKLRGDNQRLRNDISKLDADVSELFELVGAGKVSATQQTGASLGNSAVFTESVRSSRKSPSVVTAIIPKNKEPKNKEPKRNEPKKTPDIEKNDMTDEASSEYYEIPGIKIKKIKGISQDGTRFQFKAKGKVLRFSFADYGGAEGAFEAAKNERERIK